MLRDECALGTNPDARYHVPLIPSPPRTATRSGGPVDPVVRLNGAGPIAAPSGGGGEATTVRAAMVM